MRRDRVLISCALYFLGGFEMLLPLHSTPNQQTHDKTSAVRPNLLLQIPIVLKQLCQYMAHELLLNLPSFTYSLARCYPHIKGDTDYTPLPASFSSCISWENHSIAPLPPHDLLNSPQSHYLRCVERCWHPSQLPNNLQTLQMTKAQIGKAGCFCYLGGMLDGSIIRSP